MSSEVRSRKLKQKCIDLWRNNPQFTYRSYSYSESALRKRTRQMKSAWCHLIKTNDIRRSSLRPNTSNVLLQYVTPAVIHRCVVTG